MKTLFPVYLLLAATALCQSPAYQSPIYPRLRLTDGSDLYQRLMASDYVVIGRVTKLETPDERLSKEEKAKRFGPSFNLSQVKPNSLTTISIDAPLCRNADFLPGAPLVADFPKEAQVFITWGELPALDDVHYIETLVLGEKYLLFLMKDPKQAEIVKRYELNPDVTYYRAVDQNRGHHSIAEGDGEGKERRPRHAIRRGRDIPMPSRADGQYDRQAARARIFEVFGGPNGARHGRNRHPEAHRGGRRGKKDTVGPGTLSQNSRVWRRW